MLIESFRVSVDTLRGNPLRTFLSTLGIVIGVAGMVAVLSLADGMENFARTEIGLTTDLQTISVTPRLTRELDGMTVPLDSIADWSPAEIAAMAARLPRPAAAGLTDNGLAVSTLDGAPHPVEVIGTMASLRLAQGLVPLSGRMFSDDDTLAQVVMLSRKATRTLSPKGHQPLRVGDSVTIGTRRLAVIGVLSGSQTDARVAAVMPITAARAFARPGSRWAPTLIVRANRVEDVSVVRAAVERWLAARHGARWTTYARIGSRSDRVQQAEKGFRVLRLVMGAITGICLLVGGIGVMNVLLASVIERTREIGVRRAVGAARRDILAQFLAESVTICAAGSMMGVLLGLAGAFGATALIRAQTKAQIFAGLSLSTIASAAFATIAVGLAFGLYPALTASRLSPIDAIRHE